ncbi:enoyl-CoA hydratase-related protein [Staphylococcus aureus]
MLSCDLTIAADNAIFGQTGPKVGSFDAGYGSGYLARIVGHKKARENLVLMSSIQCTRSFRYGSSKYSGSLEKVEDETVQWCKEIMKHSPTALRFLKAAMNADTDGLAGLDKWLGMQHCFITQLMKRKKAVMRLKKNVILTQSIP